MSDVVRKWIYGASYIETELGLGRDRPFLGGLVGIFGILALCQFSGFADSSVSPKRCVVERNGARFWTRRSPVGMFRNVGPLPMLGFC